MRRGTLRSNLDMEGLLSYHKLFESLKRVHLIETDAEAEDSAVNILADTAVTSSWVSTMPPTVDLETTTQASTVITPEPTVADRQPEPKHTQDNPNIFTNLSMPISTGGA